MGNVFILENNDFNSCTSQRNFFKDNLIQSYNTLSVWKNTTPNIMSNINYGGCGIMVITYGCGPYNVGSIPTFRFAEEDGMRILDSLTFRLNSFQNFSVSQSEKFARKEFQQGIATAIPRTERNSENFVSPIFFGTLTKFIMGEFVIKLK